MDFLHKHNQWTASSLIRTETIGDRVLTPERLYVVDIEFHVPESTTNAEMGNWMVQVRRKRESTSSKCLCRHVRAELSLRCVWQVDLLTKDNKLLGRSVRPLILRYRSWPVRVRRGEPIRSSCPLRGM